MWAKLLGFLPNPYVILTVLALWASSVGFAFWKGYQWADRSAEIKTLQDYKVKSDALITELRAEAVTSRAIADRASTRATTDEQALQGLQERINVLIALEEGKPAEDVCRLNDAQYLSLSELARAARAGKAGAPVLPSGARPR
jgi:hypothetical protein